MSPEIAELPKNVESPKTSPNLDALDLMKSASGKQFSVGSTAGSYLTDISIVSAKDFAPPSGAGSELQLSRANLVSDPAAPGGEMSATKPSPSKDVATPGSERQLSPTGSVGDVKAGANGAISGGITAGEGGSLGLGVVLGAAVGVAAEATRAVGRFIAFGVQALMSGSMSYARAVGGAAVTSSEISLLGAGLRGGLYGGLIVGAAILVKRATEYYAKNPEAANAAIAGLI